MKKWTHFRKPDDKKAGREMPAAGAWMGKKMPKYQLILKLCRRIHPLQEEKKADCGTQIPPFFVP